MNGLTMLGVSVVGLLATGCTTSYTRVLLHQGDVDRQSTYVPYRAAHVCTSSGERLPLDQTRPESSEALGAPADPSLRAYLVGGGATGAPPNSERTPSPFAITGIVVGSTGLAAMLVSLVTLIPQLGPEGGDIPKWSGPLALAGLGTLAVGGAFDIVAAVNPRLGTTKIASTVTDAGEASVCYDAR